MTYKIAICNDEVAESKYLTLLISTWIEQSENLTVLLSTFNSTEEFLSVYEKDKDFDILLLNIEMDEINEIDLAKRIHEEDSSLQIVFVTRVSDYKAHGYEVPALHYLKKPVRSEKLLEVLNQAVANLHKSERPILFQLENKTIRIPADSIMFAKASEGLVVVHTIGNSFHVKSSISAVKKLLGDEFVRCHRSYIVSLKYIREITKTDVVLDNDKSIPLARTLYSKVNQDFISFSNSSQSYQ